MRMDKFTTAFQDALADGQSIAIGRGQQMIEPLHVMRALLNQEHGSITPLLTQGGVNVNQLMSKLEEALDRLPQVEGNEGEVHVSPDLARLLNISDKLSQKKGDSFISSETFLLACLENKNALADILQQAGLNKTKLNTAIEKIRGGKRVESPNAEETRGALGKYTIDLTQRAEVGKLDPVIVRDDEIRRTIQVRQR